MGSFDLAVQPWGTRLDADVADALVEQVPVEGLAAFLTVVGLDLLDGEGELGQHVVGELDCGLLVVAGVGAQDAQPGCSRRSRCIGGSASCGLWPSGSMNLTSTCSWWPGRCFS